MDMCKHGYMPGTCPRGCSSTADDSIPPAIPPGPKVDWEDKLHCVICGQSVERGIVYKGKPLCGDCIKGLPSKREKEEVGTIGGLTKELAEKKFPMQGEELKKKGPMQEVPK